MKPSNPDFMWRTSPYDDPFCRCDTCKALAPLAVYDISISDIPIAQCQLCFYAPFVLKEAGRYARNAANYAANNLMHAMGLFADVEVAPYTGAAKGAVEQEE